MLNKGTKITKDRSTVETPVDLMRRTVVTTTGIGLGAIGLSACGGGANSPNQAPAIGNTGGSTPVPDPEPRAAGTYSYDASEDSMLLSLNLGEQPACNLVDETRGFKIRALYHDSMVWRVETMEVVDGVMEPRLFIMQWIRISASDTSAAPSIVGKYRNRLGYELDLKADGTTDIAFTGDGCDSYGYLGDVTLPTNVFRQGVASGDPSASGAILWTRSKELTPIKVEVSNSPLFTGNVLVMQTVTPTESDDRTVKITVDSTSLSAATEYYYRFSTTTLQDSEGELFFSDVARFKTLPTGTGVESLKFGVASCSSYPHGYFNVYRQMARRDDLDLVFHLGDYIYDYPGVVADGDEPTEDQNPDDYADGAALADGRFYRHDNRKETVELDDYRTRFRNYREDADLQLIHLRYAFINTWDDHETANDSYDPDLAGVLGGAQNHNDHGRDEGDWEPRKAAAAQAYNEWLPIQDVRGPNGTGFADPRLNRSFTFGDLAEFIILDTRIQGRDKQPDQSVDDYDGDRKMMSDDQESWLFDKLDDAQVGGGGQSARTWKFLGQQTMIGHLVGPPLSTAGANTASPEFNSVTIFDQWDGYNQARNRVLDKVRGPNATGESDNAIENFVVLTGDIHTSWAINIEDDPRQRGPQDPVTGVYLAGANTAKASTVPPSKRFGVEFVTPSVTSPGLPDPNRSLSTSLNTLNPHMEYIDLSMHGYTVTEVTPTQTTCNWYHVPDILDVESEGESNANTASVMAGTPVLVDSVDQI